VAIHLLIANRRFSLCQNGCDLHVPPSGRRPAFFLIKRSSIPSFCFHQVVDLSLSLSSPFQDIMSEVPNGLFQLLWDVIVWYQLPPSPEGFPLNFLLSRE
jgi:hypothetical protein